MQRQQASDGAEHERLRGALAALRERCASHAKERRALAAILDNKVLALLTHVAGLLQGTSASGGGGGEGGGLGEGAARARAQHELGVLQRLVGASVSALRMPDAVPEADGAEENRSQLARPMLPAQGGAGATGRGGSGIKVIRH